MRKIKILLVKVTSLISLKFYYRLAYFHNRGKWLNLKKTTNLSEFIISQIVSGEINAYAIYADKYRVRNFVKKRGLSHILTQLYGSWTDANDINFDTLPNQFVLKQNAGCKLNIICFDKTKLDIQEVRNKLNHWMQIKVFARKEPHYDRIEKCIIAEELIQDGLGNLPVDYKFQCINGKIHHILVCTDRDKSTRLHMYGLNWIRKNNLVKKKNEKYDDAIPRPKNLDKMIEYAAILAQGFEYVRVDLYDTGDKVYFGELTFTPHSGLLRYYTIEALEEMLKFRDH
ncbi:MAG: hypothetical protein FWH23_00830 [Bacteroidales bacterium]|nr:hypothetical protein [Bacteroidales bacterium]